MPFERCTKPQDAALTADPANLEGLRLNCHYSKSSRPLDEVPADSLETVTTADLEL